ncbi:site-specific integrase [Colwellia psychrerythraea]|uniref:Tyr recombinase domain-containing protein n=1 Tax=Colwellia psychrerythraea TaxID=28229 RepID=A0A099KHB5_COLPS|nr:site-specific integrase [Colwellia psychrerythraea]KGJ89615.1 hypothetical protein ND2E_3806 [Colwellia psychrerythraea]
MLNVIQLNNNDTNRAAYSEDQKRYNAIKARSIKEQTGIVKKVTSTKAKLPMLVCDFGFLHEHANNFLLTRYNNPDFFNVLVKKNAGRKAFKSITLITMNNMADHMRNWLNICAHQGCSYLDVNMDFFNTVLKIMRDSDDDDFVAESSIAVYLETWRLFYEYLDLMNINHNIEFPAKIRQERERSKEEDNSDILNHTRRNNKSTILIDPLLDNKRMKKITNYTSQVLTEYQLQQLIIELNKIDRVYAVMAHVQLDTLMRINEVVHHFPYKGNSRNPNWMNGAQMMLSVKTSQPLSFIGKGQVDREIDVDIRTMKLIENKYITAKSKGSDITIYDQRKNLFLTKYLTSKNGKESKYSSTSDVLWLSASGRPISKAMYRKAFSKAAKALRNRGIIDCRIYLRPHGMRHTGATLRLIKYSKETGVKICTGNIDPIHIFLQDLLGHASQKTTKLYISTITKLKIGNLAKKTILKHEDLWADDIKNNPMLAKGVDAIKS